MITFNRKSVVKAGYTVCLCVCVVVLQEPSVRVQPRRPDAGQKVREPRGPFAEEEMGPGGTSQI